jgi:FMN phosphatase YigB (HAD superfamily)
MGTIRAVIFDLDGTLTDFNPWVRFTAEMHGSESERAAILEDYLFGRISYPLSRKKMLALWRHQGDTSRANIERIFTS